MNCGGRFSVLQEYRPNVTASVFLDFFFFFQEKLEIQIFLVNVEGERYRSAQILGTDLKKKNTKNYLTTSPDQNKTCLRATHGLEPPKCSFRLGDNT